MTKPRIFTVISWGITALIVAGILAFAYLRLQKPGVAAAAPVAQPTATDAAQPVTYVSTLEKPAITRALTLKTIIPERPRYGIGQRTVLRGDSISAIAKEFTIKPDTLLFANYDILQDSPDSLRPGQELQVPPTDGILYQWKTDDTVDKVAAEYKASSQDILDWSGNNIDLTNPQIKTGQWVMIPNGTRESRAQVIQTAGAGGSAASSKCGGAGLASRGFFSWPAVSGLISGNDYSGGHPGVDIAVVEGEPILSADNGVVTMAQGGWNYGYGNVIQVDHRNGFVTLYAHLSEINVGLCASVYGGQMIGKAGNTGNSFGTHLHFEIRANGTRVNPWNYLP
jgi:murein DD-endopeptidase MepM/ murein hydrolase activator NlpD